MFGVNESAQEIASGVTVSRISFVTIALYFIGYIVLHTIIALKYKEEQKILSADDTEEQRKKVKYWGYAFKWFPAVYVIFILITMI